MKFFKKQHVLLQTLLLALAFFLPFERLGAIDISGVTVRPSQIIALIAMATVAAFYLVRKKTDVPHNPLLLPLTAFFIVALLGLFNAPHLDRSITVLLFQLFTCGIALLIPFLLEEKEQLIGLLKWLLIGTTLVTLFGVFQFVGDFIGLSPEITGLRPLYTKAVLGFPRVQSTALEPLYFANYLLIPLSILLAFFLHKEKSFIPHFGTVPGFKQWIIFALLGLVCINLLLTVARGAYIAAVPTVCIIALYYARHILEPRVVIAASSAAIILLIVIAQFGSLTIISNNFLSHVKNIFGGASYVERVDMFSVALDAWEKHPIIGIGSGSFGPYQAPYPYESPKEGWKIVNNEYIELLAENGILGLLAMLIVFTIVLIRSLKAIRRSHDPLIKVSLIAFFAAFVGILVQYNTFSILYIVHIWFVIGVLIALQNMVLQPPKR